MARATKVRCVGERRTTVTRSSERPETLSEKTRYATTSALMAAISTAPAETSLAIFARGSNSSVMMSTTASTAVLIISAMSTKQMVAITTTSSSRERLTKRLAMSTRKATAKWILMLR